MIVQGQLGVAIAQAEHRHAHIRRFGLVNARINARRRLVTRVAVRAGFPRSLVRHRRTKIVGREIRYLRDQILHLGQLADARNLTWRLSLRELMASLDQRRR